MTLTPNDALIHQAQTRPNDTAFVFHDVVWTYQKLATEAERLARALAARGVASGDRVALHMMNRPEFIVAYYACFRLGAIVAPLRTAFTLGELGPILQRIEPALYLGEVGLYGNVAGVDAKLLPPSRRFVLVVPRRMTRTTGVSSHGRRCSRAARMRCCCRRSRTSRAC
jgi:long-chain acyl-CoA synthetase